MNVRGDGLTSMNRRSSAAIGLGLGALALAAAGISCGGESRALVLIDLTGDSSYSSVDVGLIANGGASKTFQGLTFSDTLTASVGIYVADPGGGDVVVVARVERDHCLVGQGQVTVTGVKAGGPSNKGVLLVHRATSCVPSDAGAGAGGSTGSGGSGAGGAPGTGGVIAGSGGRMGSGGTGAGGVTGIGGAGAGGAGTGGVRGTGGAGTGGVGTGGVRGTGGAGTGGAGTGGVTGTGGAGTGGVSGTGGAGTGGAGSGGSGGTTCDGICVGSDLYACTPTGDPGALIQHCIDGCTAGACVDLCAIAQQAGDSTGCEFWPVDMDNLLDVTGTPDPTTGCATRGGSLLGAELVCFQQSGKVTQGTCDLPNNTCPAPAQCLSEVECGTDAQHGAFTIAVVNPQSRSVQVTLTNATMTQVTVMLAPGEARELVPSDLGFPDQSLDGSQQAALAYELTSDAPVAAFQFNPLAGSPSSDASMLLPQWAFNDTFLSIDLASTPHRPSSNDLNGYITVVATRDNTEVDLTNSVGIRASKTFDMIPATQFIGRFHLKAFEVLNLEAVANGNLSGSFLQSNLLIEVFVGHEGVLLPSKAPDAVHVVGPTGLGHVEDTLPAVSLGGKTYAITRSKPRLSPQAENDVIQLMGTWSTATHLTFNPPPAKGSCATLNYKQACQVEIATDTLITADQLVVAGHYWQSAIWSDTQGNSVGKGAPSFAGLVPAERFSKDHLFYSPPSFSENYAAVSVPQGGSIQLDGVDSSNALAPLPGGSFLGATLVLSAGAHHIVCDPNCSVEAYGYGATSAYSYPVGVRIR